MARILVIDCEQDACRSLAICFHEAGFHVDTATNGFEALEKIGDNPPDLITLDISMPRRSGIRVLRELHQNKVWARIPVIIIRPRPEAELDEEERKEYQAIATTHRPHYVFEKPLVTAQLVGAAQGIL